MIQAAFTGARLFPNYTSGMQRPLRILIADDEPAILMLMRAYLEGDGHLVEEAADGKEAQSKFGDGEGYDLVLTDRAMPNLSGDELATHVKEISPETPVILVTGYLTEAAARNPAFSAIIEKPFNAAILRKAMSLVCKA